MIIVFVKYSLPLQPKLIYMKHLLSILVALLPLCASYADTYSCLTFVTSAGSERISVSNLVLTVENTTLKVTNGEQTLSFNLSELQTMYFSGAGSSTSLEITAALSADAETAVYGLAGQAVGQYSSLREAVTSLQPGAYILRQGSQSEQILIR